jgi:sulfur-carrier protein
MIIEFFATLRSITKEKSTIIPKTKNLRSLFSILEDKYGKEITGELLQQNGEMVDGLIVLKNGENVFFLKKLDTELTETDKISIFTPLGGG